MAELDDILAGRDDTAAQSQPRDDHGRFASTSAPPAEPVTPTPEPTPASSPVADTTAPPAPVQPTPAPTPAPTHIPEAALLDERRKRQERDRELQELRAQLQALQQPQPQQPPQQPPPDFWADPQGFVQAQMAMARQEALQEAQVQMRHQFAEMCELQARSRYPDYIEVRDRFLARVESDPVLRAELTQARDPADFAYQTGKRLQEVEQIGSLDAWREQQRAQIRAELEAQFRPAATPPPVPASLNAESSAPTSVQTLGDAPTLDQLLKRK